MGFFQKAFNLLGSPTHSRTTAILVALIIVAAIPLTVIVSQQQQDLRQRAANELGEGQSCNLNNNKCAPGLVCAKLTCLDANDPNCIGTCIDPTSPTIKGKITINSFNTPDKCFGNCQIAQYNCKANFQLSGNSTENFSVDINNAITPISYSFSKGLEKNKNYNMSMTLSNCSGSVNPAEGYLGIVPTDSNLTIEKDFMINNLTFNSGIASSPTPTSLPTNTPTPTSTPIPTKTPTPTSIPSASTGYQDCFIPIFSDAACQNQFGSYPSGCLLNNPSVSKIGVCTQTPSNPNSKSEKVSYCGPCAINPPPINNPTQPTATPAPTTPAGGSSPTATPAPGDVVFVFPPLTLEGAADISTHKDQSLTVYLYKSTDDPKSDTKGNNAAFKKLFSNSLKYNTTNKNFSTSLAINLGNITPGAYKVLIKSDKYLRKLVATIDITANGGNINIASPLSFFAGDVDNNNALNIQDYEAIRSCFGDKANTTDCKFKETADLNDDGLVDGLDYNLFIKNLNLTERQGD